MTEVAAAFTVSTPRKADPSLVGCAVALGGATLAVIATWLPLWDSESFRRAHPGEPDEHLLLAEDLERYVAKALAVPHWEAR